MLLKVIKRMISRDELVNNWKSFCKIFLCHNLFCSFDYFLQSTVSDFLLCKLVTNYQNCDSKNSIGVYFAPFSNKKLINNELAGLNCQKAGSHCKAKVLVAFVQSPTRLCLFLSWKIVGFDEAKGLTINNLHYLDQSLVFKLQIWLIVILNQRDYAETSSPNIKNFVYAKETKQLYNWNSDIVVVFMRDFVIWFHKVFHHS
jgi:hypothetical protein